VTGQRPASARRIVELLAEHPGALTRDALLAAVRARIPSVPAQRVAQLLGAAIGDGSITDDGSVLRAAGAGPDELRDVPAPLRRPGPRRAVVVDVESIVRTTSVEPYTDKRIYQIGAARTGADFAWVQAASRFRVWVELPDEDWIIRSPTVRERHAAAAVPPTEALGALMEYLREADIVAAYNGLEADFPLLPPPANAKACRCWAGSMSTRTTWRWRCGRPRRAIASLSWPQQSGSTPPTCTGMTPETTACCSPAS
jgi:hypothetical protein